MAISNNNNETSIDYVIYYGISRLKDVGIDLFLNHTPNADVVKYHLNMAFNR